MSPSLTLSSKAPLLWPTTCNPSPLDVEWTPQTYHVQTETAFPAPASFLTNDNSVLSRAQAQSLGGASISSLSLIPHTSQELLVPPKYISSPTTSNRLHWGHPTPATLFLLALRLQTLNNAPAFVLSVYYCPPSTQPVQVIFTKGKSDHFPPSHSFPSRLACGWSKVFSVGWWAWHPLVPAGFTRGISHHSLFYSPLLMLAFSPFSEHIQLAPAYLRARTLAVSFARRAFPHTLQMGSFRATLTSHSQSLYMKYVIFFPRHPPWLHPVLFFFITLHYP